MTVQNKIQLILNQAKRVARTTDIWTSINTDSYLTITTHFLNRTQFETFVLCTKKLESSHTGLYLSRVIADELMNWNIYEKVIAVVTDGGANIKSAIRMMNLAHIPCTAHKLNLVVQQSIKCNDDEEVGPEDNTDEGNLRTILKKCRSIVGFFKRSEEGKRLLDDKQKQLGSPTVWKLKQDVCTRWNSTFIMLERLVKLKEPLSIVVITLKVPSYLNSDDWNVIEDIIPLLRPFNKLTIELSAENYPTISKVIPLIRGNWVFSITYVFSTNCF